MSFYTNSKVVQKCLAVVFVVINGKFLLENQGRP